LLKINQPRADIENQKRAVEKDRMTTRANITDRAMHNVLVVDFSIFKNSILKMLRDKGYGVELCESAYDAMVRLKAADYDLVVADIELPGDNAFDLYKYISVNYPQIATIMTTEKSTDTFFDIILREGIGNVLTKPFKKEEILNLANKLITKKNIFGLSNYIDDIIETKRIRITDSLQINPAVSAVIGEIKKWGFAIKNEINLNLILNEMIINAVYHSHGLSREKKQRVPVRLGESEFVDVFFAHSAGKYGIAINDYKGKLTKTTILDAINRAIVQNTMISEAAENNHDVSELVSETGRGIDLVRKLAGEYYFIIKKDVRTEIIIIFDKWYENDASMTYSSLKIIED
jgi:CheY-like chemotaxis protein